MVEAREIAVIVIAAEVVEFADVARIPFGAGTGIGASRSIRACTAVCAGFSKALAYRHRESESLGTAGVVSIRRLCGGDGSGAIGYKRHGVAADCGHTRVAAHVGKGSGAVGRRSSEGKWQISHLLSDVRKSSQSRCDGIHGEGGRSGSARVVPVCRLGQCDSSGPRGDDSDGISGNSSHARIAAGVTEGPRAVGHRRQAEARIAVIFGDVIESDGRSNGAHRERGSFGTARIPASSGLGSCNNSGTDPYDGDRTAADSRHSGIAAVIGKSPALSDVGLSVNDASP